MLSRRAVFILMIASAGRVGLGQTAGDRPETVSLLGAKLHARPASSDPKTIESWLALGKAQADLWRYNAAIATQTEAIRAAPSHPLLYRHRGHRYISTRQFGRAIEDLERDFEIFRQIVAGRHWPAFGFIAAEVELARAR